MLPPPNPTRAVTSAIENLTERLEPSEGGRPSLSAVHLQRYDRADLRNRLDDIHDALVPTPAPGALIKRDPTRLELALATLDAMPAGNAAVGDVRTTMAVYTQALSDLPGWAVMQACRDASRGVLGSFRPGTAQLHAQAERILQPLRAEAERIEAILGARVIPVPDEEVEAARAATVSRCRAAIDDLRLVIATTPPRNVRAASAVR